MDYKVTYSYCGEDEVYPDTGSFTLPCNVSNHAVVFDIMRDLHGHEITHMKIISIEPINPKRKKYLIAGWAWCQEYNSQIGVQVFDYFDGMPDEEDILQIQARVKEEERLDMCVHSFQEVSE